MRKYLVIVVLFFCSLMVSLILNTRVEATIIASNSIEKAATLLIPTIQYPGPPPPGCPPPPPGAPPSPGCPPLPGGGPPPNLAPNRSDVSGDEVKKDSGDSKGVLKTVLLLGLLVFGGVVIRKALLKEIDTPTLQAIGAFTAALATAIAVFIK